MKSKNLAIMFALSFAAMLASAYSTVYAFDHIFFSLNKFYMALLMTGLMGIINATVMFSMYTNKKLLLTVLVTSVVVTISSFLLIRTQGQVGNREFLRSMIPHHSAAILVCEESNITDPEIVELCDEIVKTQREEIVIMKEILEKY